MGVINRNNIVTNGLLYYYDAANTSVCHISGSNKLINLVGQTKIRQTASFIGSTIQTSYKTFGGGSIQTVGGTAGGYIRIQNDSFGYSPGTTGEFTLEIWVNPTGSYQTYTTPPYQLLGGMFGQGYNSNNVGWGIGYSRKTGNTPPDNFYCQVRNLSNFLEVSGSITDMSAWYHVSLTFARNNYLKLYLNGYLVAQTSSISLNGISLTPDINNAKIGKINDGSGFFANCYYSICRLYNRPLSQQEVLQNYNATKTRFGM